MANFSNLKRESPQKIGPMPVRDRKSDFISKYGRDSLQSGLSKESSIKRMPATTAPMKNTMKKRKMMSSGGSVYLQ